uniref:ORF1 protein n=1 Tax=Hemp virus T TaxID=3064295 RepID=A0AA50AFZ0_9VIRU|nr:MAG: RNA-dependent RNA polymerase [Hemp virus T]
MSFAYRSPQEIFLQTIPQTYAEPLYKKTSESISKIIDDSDFFKYSCSSEVKERLVKAGLPISPFLYLIHSHPACKMLENYMLFVCAKDYIFKNKSVLISMKECKINILCRRNDVNIPFLNRLVVAKDSFRYDEPSVCAINELAVKVRDSGRKSVFIHDEVHYWSMEDLNSFISISEVDNILCTIVFPPEILNGSKSSLNPELYSFKIVGDRVVFAPDGNYSESYTQPKRCDILRLRGLNVGSKKYAVTMLKSVGAHHLVFIKKMSYLNEPEVRFFDTPSAVDFNLLLPGRLKGSCKIRLEILKKMIAYLLALKKSDANSAVAKLRSLSVSEIYLDEITLAMHLGKVFENLKLQEAVGIVGIFDRLLLFVKDVFLMDGLIEWSDRRKEESALRFISNLDSYSLSIETFVAKDRLTRSTQACESDSEGEFDGVLENEINDRLSDPYFIINGSDVEGDYDDLTDCVYLESGLKLLPVWPDEIERSVREIRERDRRSESFYKPGDFISFEELHYLINSKELNVGNVIYRRNSMTFQVRPLLIEGCPKSPEMEVQLPVEMDFEFDNQNDKGKDVTDIEDIQIEDPLIKASSSRVSLNCGCGMSIPIEEVDGELNLDFVNFKDDLKNRVATFFSRNGEGYSYNGGSHQSDGWPEELDKILRMLNVDVNDYNHCLVQKYKKGGKIGFHSDNESCYPKGNEILTVSIGEGIFSIKCERGSGMTNLNGKVHFKMPKGFQETHKHSVSCTEGRISMTFRSTGKQAERAYVDDAEVSDDYNGEEGCISDDDEQVSSSFQINFDQVSKMIKSGGSRNACLLVALADLMNSDKYLVLSLLVGADSSWIDWFIKDDGAGFDDVVKAVTELNMRVNLYEKEKVTLINPDSSYNTGDLYLSDGHISSQKPSNFEGIRTFGSASFFSDFLTQFERLAGAGRVKYDARSERANALIESFQDNFTGVFANKFKLQLERVVEDKSFEIVSITGFAGSGKSRGVQALMRGMFNKKNSLVISPRKALLEDWRVKLKEGFKGRLKTFEVALKEIRCAELIIVDELTLFPNGYLDLLLLSSKAQIVVLYDPMQARYFPRNDSFKLSSVHDVDRIEVKEYLMYSHRMSKSMDMFDVNCLGSGELWEFHNRRFNEAAAMYKALKDYDCLILAPSESKKIEMEKFGRSSTFGSAQGLSSDYVVIVVDQDAFITSQDHWIVALTRARKGIAFLYQGFRDVNVFAESHRGTLIGKVLLGKKVSEDHLIFGAGTVLKKARIIREPESMKDEAMEIKLSGDPWLKGQLNLLENVELDDVEPREVDRNDSPPRTHLNMCTEDAFCELSEIKAREYREFLSPSDMSNQFNDIKTLRGKNWNNYVYVFETIYPRHQSSDDLTFFAAIQKRLLRSNPEKEARKLEKSWGIGSIMFHELKRTLGLNPNVYIDEEVVNREFVQKRLNKSAKLIENHSGRSDPDWRLDHFFLFMKSQLCTKFEKRFVDAKAGQTLACFSHQILTRFGVAFRIFEKKFSANLPKAWYVHTMKNFDQLNLWACENVKEREGTESDYEAFDRSQDAPILAFEILMLRFFNWPEDLIQDYKMIKLWMGCRLGAVAIMRFTGEFGTFFFNTLVNMAFTVMRYHVNRESVIAFAGDDMYAAGFLKRRVDLEFALDQLTLKAKVQFTRRPMFCGWYMTPMGIVKEPRLVLERWKIAEQKGNLRDVIINYALEVSYGYRLGEYLWEVLDNLESQQEIVRKIVKSKHLLPLKVRHFFSAVDNETLSTEFSEYMGQHSKFTESCGLECSLFKRA